MPEEVRAAEAQGVRVETARFDLRSADPLPVADRVILADVPYQAGLAPPRPHSNR